ncbi:MAG: NgoFVII family restriction endonuclease, partial [Succinivibrionaceae bacterium]|nr:NgoFVII family restriction endonuclease [Succinivibrionaceae bacterium]
PLFKAVTKDEGTFYMRMAQDNNKAIHTAESNALLGKWLRHRLGVPEGAPVSDEDFERYGKSKVTFYKFADDVFVMDF